MFEITAKIGSFIEYLNFIKEYQENNKEELWYRGQRNSEWNLEPSIFRAKKINLESDISLLKYSGIPYFLDELNDLKNELGESIQTAFNNFHIMFLGQHHKLLTPALDWSTDPLVALYFALDEYEKTEGVSPLIFILKPNKVNRTSMIVHQKDNSPILEPYVIDDVDDGIIKEWYEDMNNTPFSIVPFAVKSNKYISYRISRQSGVFTLHDARQPLDYSWIETKIENEPLGITIEIEPDAVEDIRSYLKVLNINKNTLYGNYKSELDYLCEKITRNTRKI